MEDNETIENIKEIYNELSNFVKYVGAAKVMYLLKPEVFIMWDNKMINHYSKDYRNDKSVGKN